MTRVMYGINSFQLNWNVVLNYFAVFRFVEIISLRGMFESSTFRR